MKIPTIHLNGTSRESLLEQQTDAYTQLQNAITAMKVATPNGRDYYPQGEKAHRKAMQEHDDRLSRLFGVLEELEEIVLGIEDQD